jgi:hypothetical protein
MRSWSSPAAAERQAHRVPGSDPADRLLRLRVYLFAVAVPLLIRLPLPRLGSLLTPCPARARADSRRGRQVQADVEAVLGSGLPLVRSGCLVRGITRYFFLRRVGLPVELCFGAGFVDGEFAAHCWLVRDGEPFLEGTDPRPAFAEMYRIPAARREPGA